MIKMMALQEFQRLHDYSTVENGHQILSNSVSNSSTNSNASVSAFSISSNLSENGQCPQLPKSFIDNTTHQCLKPGLIKHPLIHQHASNQSHLPLSNHFHHHFHHKTRPQNILPSNLHRKIEYTGSGSSSTLSSGCVSASSSSHYFPSSAICSPLSGPQTPQSTNCYVQSPLAQSFTTDSGLCLSFRSDRLSDKLNEKLADRLNERLSDRINDKSSNSSSSVDQSNEIKKNSNTIKKIDLTANKKSNLNSFNIQKTSEQQLQKSLLNLPSVRKKDTDDESLLSDYSKDLSSSNVSNCGAISNLNSINATSTTNLVSAVNQVTNHQPITSKPSLPTGASSSFFHYPNIYNPLKNSKNNTKNNKKLIRFMTVLAYVIAVSLVAILLSLYYLFIWNPYTKSNGNFTVIKTYINSEILLVERTNYYDVDSNYAHPHVIGSSPDFKVTLNRTESKIIIPYSAEPAQEIDRFNWNNGPLVSSQTNSEERDGTNGDRLSNRPTNDDRLLSNRPQSLALKKSSPSSNEQDYSAENSMQQSSRYISGSNSKLTKPQ